ncbi:hypothetical protein GCM10010191_71580 [Actinomadura vinacea]|uniref:Transposase n=1 Tax=Actinomadura vinacea TaxID=115336 RepID=A0ABN3K285_9ACTN
MDFDGAADELYGVVPGEFMETRKRLVQEARSAGDGALAKRIGSLRRPTLSAWAVDLLSRSAGDELDQLLDVGARLREAWSSGGGIGGLEQRRGELVGRLVRRARALAEEAGQPLRDPAVREVEDTLQAAAVDAEVAEEVARGRLAQPRSHTGFVPAGFPLSPDRPAPAEPVPAAPEEAGERAEREKAHRAALRKAEQTDRDLADREAETAEARADMESADADVGRLRRELDRAISRQEAAARRLEKAERRRGKAADAAEKAHRRARETAPPG